MVNRLHKRLFQTHFKKPCPSRGGNKAGDNDGMRTPVRKGASSPESSSEIGGISSLQLRKESTPQPEPHSRAMKMSEVPAKGRRYISQSSRSSRSNLDDNEQVVSTSRSNASQQRRMWSSKSMCIDPEPPRNDSPHTQVTACSTRSLVSDDYSETSDEEIVFSSDFDAGESKIEFSSSRNRSILSTISNMSHVLAHESQDNLRAFVQDNDSLHTLTLYIDDYQDSTFKRIVRSILANKTLRKLIILRGYEKADWKKRTAQEIRMLFRAVGSLSTLRHLVLLNFSEDSLNEVALILDQHPFLRSFHLHLAVGTVKDEFLRTLISIPNLRQVFLDTKGSFPVGLLLESTSLKELRVTSYNFVFDYDHSQSLAYGFTKNKSLVILDIEPRIFPASLNSMAYSLRGNKSLETLRFSLLNDNHGDGDAAMTQMANTISVNSTLKCLWNNRRGDFIVSPAIQKCVLDALARNQSLETLHLFFEDKNFFSKKVSLLNRNKLSTKRKSFFAMVTGDWFLTPCVALPHAGCFSPGNTSAL